MKATRRRILLAAGALAAAPFARAQKPGEKRVLGVLNPHPRPPHDYWGDVTRFRQLGWRIGENLFIERPEDPRREAALPEMAAALVRKRVDAIIAFGPEAAVEAARATKTIPIVFWGLTHPVEQGLVASYARPGGNVTGIAFATGPELVGKLLETFKEVAPRVTRVAGIVTPSAMSTVQGGKIQAASPGAARTLGLDFRGYPVSTAADIDAALDAAVAADFNAIVAFGTTTTWRHRDRIAGFAIRHRLPCATNQEEFVQSGCLFSYGANTRHTILQSITCVAKVLGGARPADIPVELPERYELAFNLKTARAIGLTIPDLLLLRADKVIS